MEEIRKISPEFLNALKIGELYEFTNLVKNTVHQLIICFRYNYINIYYRGHSVFKISEYKTKYLVEFNIGHARYTDKDRKETLCKRLYELSANFRINKDNIAIFDVLKRKNNSLKIEDIFYIYKEFIDDFFDNSKDYDYFKDEKIVKKKNLTEKDHQQKIFMKYFSMKDQYLFYDMELSLPKDVKAGSPDCLAVRTNGNSVDAVVLVEIKSTISACNGKNGIKKHYNDFNAIISNKEYKSKITAAMVNALNNYIELGLVNIDMSRMAENIKYEKLFIFTAEAKKWTENSKQKNENYSTFKNLITEREKMFLSFE